MLPARPDFVSCLRAPNPGPMTLDGTNTWVLRAPGASGCVVIDPGPDDADHIAAIVAAGPVEAIFATHRHLDHVGGLDLLFQKTDAPVRAMDVNWCRKSDPIGDGGWFELAGVTLEIMATPGHTSDSVCIIASRDSERVVFTGDTILGRGTTIVAWPDGNLGDYLASLDKLAALDGVRVLPGHGPDVADCGVIAREYRAHRHDRLDQVRAALATGARTPAEVVAHVYPDLEPVLVPAAEWTVRAALAYLAEPASPEPPDSARMGAT